MGSGRPSQCGRPAGHQLVRTAELFAAIERVISTREVPALPNREDSESFVAASSTPATSLLDPAALLAACGGDAEGLHELCEDFQTYAPGRLAEVGEALRAEDARRLREAAHKLCGLLSAFSTAAGNVAADLEDHAAQDRLDAASALAGRLEVITQELLHQLGGVSIESLRRQADAAGTCDVAAWG